MGRFSIPKPDGVEYLLQRRYFGTALMDEGPSTTEAQRLGQECEEYRRDLQAMHPEELQKLVVEERAREETERKEKAARTEAARFYHHPDAQADFEHWSKEAYWTLDEATALSLGKDPRIVKWADLIEYELASPFVQEFARRRDLATRAATCHQLTDDPSPQDFLSWAKRSGFPVPEELVEKAVAHGVEIADWQSRYKEIEALYKEACEARDRAQADLENLCSKYQELQNSAWEGFDPNSETYPRELDIALQAWRHASNHVELEKSPKQQVHEWLNKNYRDIALTREARERIAVICNWRPSGGRRRRDAG